MPAFGVQDKQYDYFLRTFLPSMFAFLDNSQVGLIDDIPTVQEFVDRFMKEAIDLMSAKLPTMVVQKAKL